MSTAHCTATAVVQPYHLSIGPALPLTPHALAALMASSSWLQIANYLSLPVSTTHSIVGGVIGVGVAAFGIDAINW